MIQRSRFSSFQRLALCTTAITYFLILVGGLVRASGAGLGCPDWPRCFGSWIPPASAAQLPPQFDPSLFNPTLMWTEYLNRLLGVTVGFLILATVVSAWRHRRRGGSRRGARGRAGVGWAARPSPSRCRPRRVRRLPSDRDVAAGRVPQGKDPDSMGLCRGGAGHSAGRIGRCDGVCFAR